jgi:hypothetical protein
MSPCLKHGVPNWNGWHASSRSKKTVAEIKTLFLSRGGSEEEWNEACKDFLEGYSKSQIIARFGTLTPYGDSKLDTSLYGRVTMPVEADEPIIVFHKE